MLVLPEDSHAWTVTIGISAARAIRPEPEVHGIAHLSLDASIEMRLQAVPVGGLKHAAGPDHLHEPLRDQNLRGRAERRFLVQVNRARMSSVEIWDLDGRRVRNGIGQPLIVRGRMSRGMLQSK